MSVFTADRLGAWLIDHGAAVHLVTPMRVKASSGKARVTFYFGDTGRFAYAISVGGDFSHHLTLKAAVEALRLPGKEAAA